MASLRIYRICGSTRNDGLDVILKRRNAIRDFLSELDVSQLADAGPPFLNEVKRLLDVAYGVIDKESVALSLHASDPSESEASSEYMSDGDDDNSIVLVQNELPSKEASIASETGVAETEAAELLKEIHSAPSDASGSNSASEMCDSSSLDDASEESSEASDDDSDNTDHSDDSNVSGTTSDSD